jgi:hypothetical protein
MSAKGASEMAGKDGTPPESGVRDLLGSDPTVPPTARVECPECGVKVPVVIDVVIRDGEDSQVIFTEPNLSDLWAHAWTHTATA